MTTLKAVSPDAPEILEVQDPRPRLTELRLAQDFTEVGVKKVLGNIPVKKPDKQHFIRTHPSPEFRANFLLVRLKDDDEWFLPSREIASAFPRECLPVSLITTVTRMGTVFLWPIPLADADGKDNSWYRTARDGAQRAMTTWLRLVANKAASGYDYFEAVADNADPQWPEITFDDLLDRAFREPKRLVESEDHPLIKKLRGIA